MLNIKPLKTHNKFHILLHKYHPKTMQYSKRIIFKKLNVPTPSCGLTPIFVPKNILLIEPSNAFVASSGLKKTVKAG